MVVDDLNMRIIDILRKNARTSFTSIAEDVRVSEATVRKRIKVLEEKKVILGYTVVLDPLKMGYNVVAIVGLDVDPKKFLFVSDSIKEMDEVRWAATSTGEHMLLMEVWAEDGQRLSRILTEKMVDDEYYVYRLDNKKKWVERKAKVDYAEHSWSDKCERGDKRIKKPKDARGHWFKWSKDQQKLCVSPKESKTK